MPPQETKCGGDRQTDEMRSVSRTGGNLRRRRQIYPKPTYSNVAGQVALSDKRGSASPVDSVTASDHCELIELWDRADRGVPGPGCYDAVAIARAAGFRMLVMSRIRHAAIVP